MAIEIMDKAQMFGFGLNTYTYDNYSNVISKTSFGNISINGDEKYENYSFVYGT
jgi:hypothetical protein